MPTINKFFLVKFLLVTGLLIAGLFGIHTIQASRIPEALKRQAERATEAGQTDRAIHYLRQYLEFRPKDTETGEQLARLIRERPGGYDPSSLLFLYDQILRDDPERDAVRREALTLCLRLGRYSDAEGHAELLLQRFNDDAEIWQKRAAAEAGLQKREEARASYEKAIALNPHNLTAYQRLAQYLWRDLQLIPDARAVLDRMVSALPDDPEAYLTRARFELYTRDNPDVLADLTRALELAPNHLDALLLMAEQRQQRRDFTTAQELLQRAVEQHPLEIRPVRALAWLELNRGNLGAAIAALEAGMERMPQSLELLVPLADLLVQLGETDRSKEIIAKLRVRGDRTSRLQVDYLRARVAMRELRWDEAVTILQQLRTATTSLPILETQVNLLLAHCYQRQADSTGEQDTLRLILNRDPNHLEARVALAQSFLNAGAVSQAIAEYEKAVRSPYASGTIHATLLRLKVNQLRLRGGTRPEWDALEQLAVEFRRAFPPAAPEPVLLRAEVAQARGNYSQAETLLRSEASRRPGDVRIWTALAQTVAEQRGVAAGLAVIDEAQALAGDGPDLRLARGELSVRDPARLRPLAPLATHIDTWPEADQLKLLHGLAELYEQLGDSQAMLSTYEQIAARRCRDLSLWEALAERAARHNDAGRFQKARRHIEQLDATGHALALADAWRALQEHNPQQWRQARTAVENAFGREPLRAEACVALAQLYANDQPDHAKRLLDRSLRLEPARFPPVLASLTFIMNQPDNEGRLEILLTRLAQDHRWNGEPLLRAVRTALSSIPQNAAQRLLHAIEPLVIPRPGGLGWLADSARSVGLTELARTYEMQALRSGYFTADDVLRRVIHAVRHQETDVAVNTIAQAQQSLTPTDYFSLVAAIVDAGASPPGWTPKVANPAEARSLAQARLSLKLSRYQRTEAIAVLQEFLQRSEIPSADQSWARRNLAMLYAIRGTPSDRQKAIQLLASTDLEWIGNADEKRATAALLAGLSRYLDGKERHSTLEQATKVLETVVKETKSPRDGFLLAQLYRASGKREASTAMMNQLLQADPKNLDYHLFALEELTDAGMFSEAAPFAQRLMLLYPNEYKAVAAVAKYECRAGHPDQALLHIESYLRLTDAAAFADLPVKSAQAAELLDSLSRIPGIRTTEPGQRMISAAIKRFEQLILTRAEALIGAAGLYGFDGRGDEGFALIHKHEKHIPNRIKAAAGLAILRAGQGSESQFRQVRDWLDAALQEEPDSIPVHLNEAEYFALRQDYPAAERIYQSILDNDPRNIVALNNLAWILAPRPETAQRALELIDRAVSEVGLTDELLDTRARVRITAKQFELAERDLHEALLHKKTPLRMFHLALVRQTQSPPKTQEAVEAFRTARERGLTPAVVHPADLPAYRLLESANPAH